MTNRQCEKVSNAITHYRNTNSNHKYISPHSQDERYVLARMWRKGNPGIIPWECALVKHYYKQYGNTSKKLKIELHNPALLTIHLNELNQHLGEISTFPCLLQHYSPQPRYGNNLKILIDE
jgi:hypothetical protein